MKKADLIVNTLKRLGCRPYVDEDGDITFRYQLKPLYAMVGDEDEPYVTLVQPYVYEIEHGEEIEVLATCNKLTRDVNLVKVYIDQTHQSVTASYEFFYSDASSLELSLKESLRLMGMIRTMFKQAKKELSE